MRPSFSTSLLSAIRPSSSPTTYLFSCPVLHLPHFPQVPSPARMSTTTIGPPSFSFHTRSSLSPHGSIIQTTGYSSCIAAPLKGSRLSLKKHFSTTGQLFFSGAPGKSFGPDLTAARFRSEKMIGSRWTSSGEAGGLVGARRLAAHALAVSGSAGAENFTEGSTASPTIPSRGTTTQEAGDSGYCLPPPEIAEIVDAPPTPALAFSPHRDRILYLHRRSLPSIADLAKPELKLGGLRIDPSLNARSRSSSYSGMSIARLSADGKKGEEVPLSGLPDGAKISLVSWSPDAKHIAFGVYFDEEEGKEGSGLMGLWVATVDLGEARQLLKPPQYALNTVFDSYVWLGDDRLVVCTIPQGRGPPPKRPAAPAGPRIQANEPGQVAQARTYQDLLKDRHDEQIFEYYCTSELTLVTLDGKVSPFGPPALYTSVSPSPDDKYLIIATLQRPFSFLVPCGRFPKRIEVWNSSGKPVRDLANLPLAEDIPISFNSVRKGPRSISWRPDRPASIYWVETQDGGDAKAEVSPRDIIYLQDAEPAEGEQPTILHKLDLRYGGVSWGGDDLALVYENWWKNRKTRTWVVTPGDSSKEAKILFDRSYEDAYSDPGGPMSRRTEIGTYVLAQISTPDGRRRLLLDGNGATPEGNIPFLDLLDLETGEKERIWQSDKETYFESISALMSDNVPDGDLPLEGLKILMSRETKQEPAQYYLRTFPSPDLIQITDFPHPYPQLKDTNKEIIKYQRSDGVQLTATLYLPPGYDPVRDGPLPLLMWAYPREFKSKDAAGQVRGSPNQFSSIGSTSPLLWLARRYAVLDGPTFPIVGEGAEEANDKYVEQLVASAQAAVDEVVRRGVAERGRIAVGGHSYGAFMAANLLAHAPHLFACGISRSGAYNRTLTPFGFQAEERTLWEAPKVYMEMSPYMHADRIKKPLLLIHGEEDNNTGTFPMQSERFFAALKGHGGHTRLVILPFESHGYRARESVMHTLYEMEMWLDQHCRLGKPDATALNPSKSDEGDTTALKLSKSDEAGATVPSGAHPVTAVTAAASVESEGFEVGSGGVDLYGACLESGFMRQEGDVGAGEWVRVAKVVLGREPHSAL